MNKQLPVLKTDEEASRFVAESDLTEYDLSQPQRVRFELRPKNKTISLRLPDSMLDDIKAKANAKGMPYHRYIRLAIERELGTEPNAKD